MKGQGSGQELTNISYDNPAYTIIFLVVGRTGQTFSFINALHNQFEFFWQRWGEWKSKLEPYSVHAFLVQTYNTKTASTQGFTPVAHLCEFAGLKQARVVNKWYLDSYTQWRAHANADLATEESLKFASKLERFNELNEHENTRFDNEANILLSNEQYEANLQFALSAQNYPLNLDEHIDNGELVEQFQAWLLSPESDEDQLKKFWHDGVLTIVG